MGTLVLSYWNTFLVILRPCKSLKKKHPQKHNKSTFLQIRKREREKHFIWQRRSRMFSSFIYSSGSQGKSRFMNKENCSYGQLIYCFNSLQSDCCDPQVFLPIAWSACLSLWWQSDKFLMDKCSLIPMLMHQPHCKTLFRLTQSLSVNCV